MKNNVQIHSNGIPKSKLDSSNEFNVRFAHLECGSDGNPFYFSIPGWSIDIHVFLPSDGTTDPDGNIPHSSRGYVDKINFLN